MPMRSFLRENFRLRLSALLAALFFLFAPTSVLAMPIEEESRVNALLEQLEMRTDAVFIRNGVEYGAAEAARHLRLKLERGKRALSGAEEFIDRAGSSSSVSGKPYLVREADGKIRPAGEFLHELLRRTQ
jgi:hypothetical protein